MILPIGFNFLIVFTLVWEIEKLYLILEKKYLIIEITISKVFLWCLHLENCYLALFCIICTSTTELRFTVVTTWCASLCSINICSSRKLPIKVSSNIGKPSKIYSLECYNKKTVWNVVQWVWRRSNILSKKLLCLFYLGKLIRFKNNKIYLPISSLLRYLLQ